MSKHTIQYQATCRARAGSIDFPCNAFIRLECDGADLNQARKNGLASAKAMAPAKLLEDARRQKPGQDITLRTETIRVN